MTVQMVRHWCKLCDEGRKALGTAAPPSIQPRFSADWLTSFSHVKVCIARWTFRNR